jgi:hypothetical protein
MTDTQLKASQCSLDGEHFPAPVFEQKKSQPKVDKETGKLGEQATYYSAPLIYKREDPKTGKLIPMQRFLVEGPEMNSDGGIRAKKNDEGRWQASIYCSHKVADESIRAFAGHAPDIEDFMKMTDEEKNEVPFIARLHFTCLAYAFDERGKIGVTGVKTRSAFEAIFKSPLRHQTGSDGIPIEGTNTSKYYNITLRGDPSKKGTRKAMFSIPSDNKEGEIVLPWDYLMEANVTFKPLIHLKSIYCGGGKMSIQMEVVGAVVTNFEPLDTRGAQVETIARMREDNALVSKLAEQLANMAALTAEIEKENEDDEKKPEEEKKEKKKLEEEEGEEEEEESPPPKKKPATKKKALVKRVAARKKKKPEPEPEADELE